MYYPYFIVYMVVGFGISVLALYWAVSREQFKDQERARFLPLEDEVPSQLPRLSRFNRYEAYALGGVVLLGLAASGAVLLFSLIFAGRGH
jgi:nitrogen fixation-related uncharacterized protein